MKKALLSTVAVITTVSSAYSADLPSRKAMVVAVPPPAWSGFYAGINAGVGIGTSNSVQNRAFALSDSLSNYRIVNPSGFNVAGSYNTVDLAVGGPSFVNPNFTKTWTQSNPQTYNFNSVLTNLLNTTFGSFGQTAFGGNSDFAANQAGFAGGGQIGYNLQHRIGGLSVVAGIETDFQGATVQGSGGATAGAPNVTTRLLETVAPSSALCPSTPTASVNSQAVPPLPPGPAGAFYSAGSGTVGTSGTCIVSTGIESISRDSITSVAVKNNVNWVGTVRGRLGWLATPDLLIYGTGGLAYGQVSSNISVSQINNLRDFGSGQQTTYSFQNTVPNGTVTYPPSVFTTYTGYTPQTFNPTPASTSPNSFSNASSGIGFGSTNYSRTRVGWTAGGGAEYLLTPNWSIKAEALYYYLGSATLSTPVNTSSANGLPGTINIIQTKVSWNGIMARAGVNYHLNWFTSAGAL